MSAPPTEVLLASEKQRAFEACVHQESGRLFGIALAILRDRGEAEEAVQETLTRAWKSWTALREPSKRPAWLARICVNHCLRRRQQRWRGWLSLGQEARLAESKPVLDRHDPDLDAAMAKLTAKQRAVVVLHYRHGYSLDECGVLLRCRPGTVRSHLHRALSMLRAELADER